MLLIITPKTYWVFIVFKPCFLASLIKISDDSTNDQFVVKHSKNSAQIYTHSDLDNSSTLVKKYTGPDRHWISDKLLGQFRTERGNSTNDTSEIRFRADSYNGKLKFHM